MIGKEAAIAYYDAVCHGALCCHFSELLVLRNSTLVGAAGAKTQAVEEAQREQQAAPPDRRVKAGQLHVGGLMRSQLEDAVAEDERSIDGEEHADEEPDRD